MKIGVEIIDLSEVDQKAAEILAEAQNPHAELPTFRGGRAHNSVSPTGLQWNSNGPSAYSVDFDIPNYNDNSSNQLFKALLHVRSLII